MLLQAWERMGERDRATVRAMHQFFDAQCIAAKATFHQSEGIAAGFHDAADNAIAGTWREQPTNAARVACRKGCAHCCHINVDITEPEARLLIHAADEAGWPIDRERLRRQRDTLDFMALDVDARRCVFLRDDKTCAVYEHRPTSCRKLFAVDTADKCDTVKHPGAQVAFFVSIEAEVIQSATLAAWPAGSMPSMLLQWLPDAA